MANSAARISIGKRLLIAAAAFQLLALIVAGSVIDGILDQFITRQIETRLDDQILALAAAVATEPDQPPSLKRDLDLPPFDRALSGWYWQITSRAGVLTSRSLGTQLIDIGTSPVRGPRGEALWLRTRTLSLPDQAGTIVITAAAPASEIQAPLTAARTALGWSLVALGVTLTLAMIAQVWTGLSPLRRLARQLSEVRAGRQRTLPTDQPAEVSELVSELNALLAQNRAQLDTARSHIASLAHGLKTPLAALSVRLDSGNAPADAENVRLVQLMDKRISHHLRRARTAALGTGHMEDVVLHPHVRDLIQFLAAIYRERGIVAEVTVNPLISVRCDAQDLDEMLGNLLDNAFKWARRLVVVDATQTAHAVTISISDDGPGLTADELKRIGQPGERLDEAIDGTGFGLAIGREIASLYGGRLELDQALIGGLRARLTLLR